ncbi:MAG: amino acid adenylation domain-containing protein, partial [Acidobacteriota bacterium]
MTDLDRRAKLLAKLRARKQGSTAAPEAAADSPKTIPRVERDGPLPLSFGQERIWLLDRLMPDSNSFNMPFALRLVGDLDADALRRAIESLIARHESLRTTFVEIDGTPKQVVHEPASVTVEVRDLSHLPEAERRRQAEVVRDELAAQPFDLERGPLFRSTLLRLSETEHHLIQVVHHIVSDGWSTGVLLRELRTLLTAYTAGEPSPLKPLAIQYADFAAWQRERLSGDYLGKLVDYWRDNLDGSAQTLALGTDRPRPAVPSHRGAKIDHAIGHRLVDRLEAFGRGERTSLYMVLLAGFDALMARLAGQDDVLVGSPVAGRQRLETEGVVGFFLNTLVLRTAVDRGQGFRSLLKAVRSTVLGATEHQEIPFEKLLEELRPERHLSQTPFFQVMFNMTNLPDLVFDLPGLRVEGLDYESISAKFDFTLYASENPKSDDERLMLTLSYDAELFDHARMQEMLDQYELLLEQLVEAPDRPIGDASLITERARRLLPDPTAPLDASWRGTIADAMLRHAAEHPDEPAVIDVAGTTTYGQLVTRSARIARRLLDEGLRHGDVVAVWAHRSAPVVDALMGVLRAGAAFTMLDPQYPVGRLLDYVELAEPRAVIALDAAGAMPTPLVDALAARCSDADGDRRIVLPASGVEPLPEITSTDGVDPEIGPEDLAYVAFTSGSTGKPKTILGRHAPLTHFLPFLAERFGFDAGDRHALLSALSHDPLHRDVFMPLYYGAAVVLPDPARIGEPGYLAEWVERQEVTILNLVPAMLQLLVSTAPEGTALGSIRHVFTVGDVLTRQDVDNLYQIAPNAVCVNYYGSTETQRAVSFVELPRPSSPDATLDPTSELGTGGLGKAALPLGRGLDGVQLLVLDADGRQVGIGEPGEIFVRSHMLARGYADPERTAERFSANPFVDDAPATDRLYRTGDLGRYLPNGDVDFLGRSDFQVQIRGFRIELQEIEMALEAHPTIGESVVLVRGEGDDKYLVAYLVAATGAEIPEPRALRHH